MSAKEGVHRGIALFIVLASCFALLALVSLTARPALAARPLNCATDNCYGLASYYPLDGLDFNDDFNSATPNTQRWNVWDNWNSQHNLTSDGQVIKIAMRPGYAGWTSAGLRSWFRLRGDFDIQVDYKNLVRGTATDGGVILHVDSYNGDNFYMRRNIASQTVDCISQINNGAANVPNAGSVTITSGSLRLTRVGSTMCGYYSTTIGGSWIQVGCNTSVEWVQDLQPLMQFALNTPSGTNTVEFDNFRMVKGQIVPDNASNIYNVNDTFTTTAMDVDKYDFTYGNAGFNGSALVLNMTPAGGWVAHGVQTKYRLEGNFDVQVDFKDFVAGAGIDGGVAVGLFGPGDDDAAIIRRQFVNSNGYQFFEHRNGGAWNMVSNVATTDTSGKMRLTRVENNVTGWYWNGASWSKAASFSDDEFRQPMNLRLELSGASPSDTKYVKYDNLKLNSGTTTLSTGNIGYTQGANYTTGKFGTALRFNGAGDYVNLGTFNPASPHNVTLSAWINMTSLGVTNGYYTNYILAKGADAFTNSYGLFVGSGNSAFSSSAVCIMVATLSGYQPLCAPIGQLIPGKWTHAAGVIDGQTYKVYVDGQLKATGTFAGTINRTTLNFRIGNQDRTSYEYYFKGQMDEPIVWNKALTDDEIVRLYNIGASPLNTSTPYSTAYGSTDFLAVGNMSAIPNMTLATSAVNVKWMGVVNATNQDFDTNVRMGSGFVSINKSALHASMDAPANVTLHVGGCDKFFIYYASGFQSSLSGIKSVGQACNATSTPNCSNVRCENSILTFTVSHFDGYGGEGYFISAMPEFGTWALMMALGLTIGGFVAIRRKK